MGEVAEALSYLPLKHKDLVMGSIRIYNARKKNKRGQIIEGCYLPKMGQIVIYAFSTVDTMPKRKGFVKKTFLKTTVAHSRNISTQNCLKVAQDRLEKTIGPLL